MCGIRIEFKTNVFLFCFSEPSAPLPPFLNTSSPTSLSLVWGPPQIPNGIIIQYNIFYEYKLQECRGEGETDTKHHILNVTDFMTWTKNVSYTIQRLHPAWNYTIWVQASTSKGFGNESAKRHFTTAESSMYTQNNYKD